jgi:hypothetical protein
MSSRTAAPAKAKHFFIFMPDSSSACATTLPDIRDLKQYSCLFHRCPGLTDLIFRARSQTMPVAQR